MAHLACAFRRSTSECSVVVQDKTTGDEVSVGSIDIKVQDVLKCQDLNPLSGKSEANFMVRSLKLKHLRSNPGHASGWITVRFRFVPYF
ncbi:hypothetical protein DUNSADRAFT_2501 [Dunaliella salina]|uniref:Encoded protein n=1 Tax=Dunaliella salina TaxID=3046 RepID=A0ABQ7FW76_DUNSA|nr:hypothetical protein DUNSADRAFT_2501 [Dunaliella salina]|eukprot:KAF5826626.1 hypothetical protein DUNSADRAFT_2501 [Dunaliella salina]